MGLHKWYYSKKFMSTPRGGDYLPLMYRKYQCKCGMKKIVTSQVFTHLGVTKFPVIYEKQNNH